MTNLSDELSATYDRLAAAWKTNDGAAVAGFFSDDGSLVNPFGERADGRAAIAAMYTQYFAGLLRGTSTSIELGQVRAVGETHAHLEYLARRGRLRVTETADGARRFGPA